jgi:hypothetical protein
MTLVKQIEGVLLAWREDLSGQFAEDAAIVVASHFQPVTAEGVVERVATQVHGDEQGSMRGLRSVRRVLEALGPNVYVVKE